MDMTALRCEQVGMGEAIGVLLGQRRIQTMMLDTLPGQQVDDREQRAIEIRGRIASIDAAVEVLRAEAARPEAALPPVGAEMQSRPTGDGELQSRLTWRREMEWSVA